MTSPLPFVDAHHHLWDLEKNNYSWLKEEVHLAGRLDPIRKSYVVKDYKEDIKNQNVAQSVHLQAECDDRIAETKWLQHVSENEGLPSAIVAEANLAAPNLKEVLDVYRTVPQMRGIRQLLNWHPSNVKMRVPKEDYLKSEAWLKGLELLTEYGLSYDLQVWAHQLAEASVIVARVPKLQFIPNHTGMPLERNDAGYQLWRDGMSKMAVNPNVAVKISGLGMTDHKWTVDSLRPYVLTTIELFGIDRCMFASNFPVDKLLSDYDTLINAFKEIVSDLPRKDQEKMFHDNAVRFYRLNQLKNNL